MARTDHHTVPGLLAEQRGKGSALIYRGRAWSHAELDDLSRRVAAGLRARGVGPGDRVGLWLPNCPAYLLLYFACTRLGAIGVAVNTRYGSVELGDIVERARVRALAFWPGFRNIDFAGILDGVAPSALAPLETLIVHAEEDEPAASAGPELPGVETVAFDDLAAAPAMDEDLSTPDSPCNIFTTSGTTKAPKFVLHTQSVIVGHGRDVARGFGYDAAGACMLQAVPLCGVFGFSQYAATLAAGAPSVMLPAFDAEEAVRLIRAHGVTHTVGADDMADRLLAACDGPDPLPSLRQFGFAKFNPALADIVERAEARGVTMCGLYGSSEVQALFSSQPADAPVERRKLAGGFPVSGQARLRARDRETGELQPHGEPGELEIRAPSVMIGYDGDDAATRAEFTEDGFFRTGDLGYTREDGSFVFLSRAGDVLRLGGFLVSPAEIEAHLLTHDAVDGCQVVGAEGERGTAAVAFVTLKPGAAADEAALRAHCKGALAGFKVPARVLVVEAFPTTESANGTKIQRGKLREMAERLIRADTTEQGASPEMRSAR